jgi:hypothetical protein
MTFAPTFLTFSKGEIYKLFYIFASGGTWATLNARKYCLVAFVPNSASYAAPANHTVLIHPRGITSLLVFVVELFFF